MLQLECRKSVGCKASIFTPLLARSYFHTISRTINLDHHCSTTVTRREGFDARILHQKSHGPWDECGAMSEWRARRPRDSRQDAGATGDAAIADARMIQVRHRSHATYSRQPRQVRKEATVTGSCVCSGVPVPG